MRLTIPAARTYIPALALTLALGGAPALAASGERAPAQSALQSALAAIRIDNFARVDDNYYRGAQPKGRDFDALASLGVKTVIDLANDGDPAEEANAKAAGMHFVRIPMSTRKVPGADTIAQFLALVNEPANQPVYVHCIGGRHRTGVMTAIYRMTGQGWSPAQAFAEMKKYKFGADFLHPEFKEFVLGFTAADVPARQDR